MFKRKYSVQVCIRDAKYIIINNIHNSIRSHVFLRTRGPYKLFGRNSKHQARLEKIIKRPTELKRENVLYVK